MLYDPENVQEVEDHIVGLWLEKAGVLYIIPNGHYNEVWGPEGKDADLLLNMWDEYGVPGDIPAEEYEVQGFSYVAQSLRRWNSTDGYYHA